MSANQKQELQAKDRKQNEILYTPIAMTPKAQSNCEISFLNKSIHTNEYNYMCISTARKSLILEKTLPGEIIFLVPSNKNIKCAEERIEWYTDNAVQNKCTSTPALSINEVTASEIDINLLLQIVEIMYNTIKIMSEQINKCTKQYINETNYIVKINTPKFDKYLSLQYEQKKMIKYIPHKPKSLKMDCFSNDQPFIAPLPFHMCKSFNIYRDIDSRYISYKVLICKFNYISMDFIKTLTIMYNNSRSMTVDTNNSKEMLSLYKQGWHVRNITQGYLLTILLKNCNVITLNVMRKLYFLIISSETQNLTIELKFRVANGIFMAYNTFNSCPLKLTQWNDDHRHIIDISPSLNAKLCKPPVGFPRNDLHCESTEVTKCKSNSSYYCDSASTLKYDSAIESDDGGDMDALYSISEALGIKTSGSTDINIRDSVISLTESIDDTVSAHSKIDLRKANGTLNFTIRKEYNLYDATMQRGKDLLMKLFHEYLTLKCYFRLPHLNYDRLIDETIFDRVILEAIAPYCVQFSPVHYYKTFLKSLGNHFAHILFSSV